MEINGFELPQALEADLTAARTLSRNEIDSLKKLLLGVERAIPKLYKRDFLPAVNRLWKSPHAKYYLGSPSAKYFPGDIDPTKAFIIGHAEPDSPIALDYRVEPPRVVYLGDYEHKSLWMELAPTYEAFIAKIRK
jgi:hypothetical protein